ncbi:carbohydrate kinase family protein [Anaerosacchariphilus polymeriproducens]|uniref:Tagatose-6-phosphate kinase n=1 Tax=Anaerosacchariphilus polymeriproducens TaxID=1812858 RepID=A0A371AVE5_9FIRM|nr:carbohydrate kinase family protein [Anaerosacchariphilus polymeriproducens]RDU23537.1 hypothetical protein DWV06_08855 [Anaerosacchariphilus polymeriproducens]
MEQLSVLCIGIACVDTIIKGFDFEKFANSEETYRVEKIEKSIGGDAANQAINLKKLSNNVRLVCGVGNDYNGNYVKSVLKDQDISLESILTFDCQTSQAIVLVDNNGQRRFISPKSNQNIPYNINNEMIPSAKIISLASIGSLPFRNLDNIQKVVETANKDNATICADVICSGWLKELQQIESVLKKIDYIFPNREEAYKLTKKNNIVDMAEKFLDSGVNNVIIKLGEKGCFFKNEKEEFIIPGVKNVRVVDTTGAGDSFAAGFITALIKQKSNKECCRYANAIAAINVQYTGTTSVSYNKEKINEYINYIRNEEKNEKSKC